MPIVFQVLKYNMKTNHCFHGSCILGERETDLKQIHIYMCVCIESMTKSLLSKYHKKRYLRKNGKASLISYCLNKKKIEAENLKRYTMNTKEVEQIM